MSLIQIISAIFYVLFYILLITTYNIFILLYPFKVTKVSNKYFKKLTIPYQQLMKCKVKYKKVRVKIFIQRQLIKWQNK